MEKRLTVIDAEYKIKEDSDRENCLIIGVVSKSLNASCWVRINDNYLSKATIKSLLKDLQDVESNLVFQAENDMLYKGPKIP